MLKKWFQKIRNEATFKLRLWQRPKKITLALTGARADIIFGYNDTQAQTYFYIINLSLSNKKPVEYRLSMTLDNGYHNILQADLYRLLLKKQGNKFTLSLLQEDDDCAEFQLTHPEMLCQPQTNRRLISEHIKITVSVKPWLNNTLSIECQAGNDQRLILMSDAPGTSILESFEAIANYKLFFSITEDLRLIVTLYQR